MVHSNIAIISSSQHSRHLCWNSVLILCSLTHKLHFPFKNNKSYIIQMKCCSSEKPSCASVHNRKYMDTWHYSDCRDWCTSPQQPTPVQLHFSSLWCRNKMIVGFCDGQAALFFHSQLAGLLSLKDWIFAFCFCPCHCTVGQVPNYIWKLIDFSSDLPH